MYVNIIIIFKDERVKQNVT